MLKKLLVGITVVMFVVGVCGTANALFGGSFKDCDVDVDFDFDIDYDLDLDLNEYWLEMVGDNIEAICQDGDGNVVYAIDQLNGSNLLLIHQDGNWNNAGDIIQDNFTPEQGMNVLTVCQDGDSNVVTNIFQDNTY